MSGPNPKLLFIAYYFPPRNGSACVRTWNVAKYLARSGWNVTVLTPDPSIWRHVDNAGEVAASLAREGIRHLVSGHRWRMLSPDDLHCWDSHFGWLIGGVCRTIARYIGIEKVIGWKKEAERVCATLSRTDVDVVLASGPPFISFQLARWISDRLGCPYILDYRDPWLPDVSSRRSAQRALACFEADIVERASAVTVVTPSLLDGRFCIGPKLHVVPNGFDPEEINQVEPYQFGHFAIVYTGNFYPPIRTVTPLMKALKRLQERVRGRSIEWKFHYYGVHGDHVCESAQQCAIAEKVVIHGRVPRAEALSAVRGSNVTVVITGIHREVTGKLFEALGMRVPVLLIGPSVSDVNSIVEITGSARKVTSDDTEGIASFLQEAMSGEVPLPTHPDMFAWPNLIKRFDAVLRAAISTRDRR